MAVIVGNAASVLDADAFVAGSDTTTNGQVGPWVWLGFSTPIGASGSVMWFLSASETAGNEFLPIALSPAQLKMEGPFSSCCGVYAACISGGCALVWLKE